MVSGSVTREPCVAQDKNRTAKRYASSAPYKLLAEKFNNIMCWIDSNTERDSALTDLLVKLCEVSEEAFVMLLDGLTRSALV